MLRAIKEFALIAAITLLAQACAMPVMQGRTGRVLPRGAIGFGGGNALGIAPTSAKETRHVAGPDETREHHGLSPASGHVTSDAWAIAWAPVFSQELSVAVSPFGRCEVGGFLGFARLGAELRCGTLDREFGSLDVAISGAIATPGLMRPTHTEYRAGIDLSLSGGTLVPLLDLYFGYVPWTRGAAYYDESKTEWTAFSSVSLERGEYRVSMPIGFALERPEDRNASTARVVVSLVPELTVAHHALEPENTEYSRRYVKQVFALFLVIRLEGVLLTEFSK